MCNVTYILNYADDKKNYQRSYKNPITAIKRIGKLQENPEVIHCFISEITEINGVYYYSELFSWKRNRYFYKIGFSDFISLKRIENAIDNYLYPVHL